MSVRVLIVDDHAVVRAGLALLLNAQEDFEPVGEAGTAQGCGSRPGRRKPDVIPLDVVFARSERPGGHAAASAGAAEGQDRDAVAMTILGTSARHSKRRERLDPSGARPPTFVLVAAIREVAQGGRYVNPSSAPGSFRPTPTSGAAPTRIRSPTASARCCACLRSVTRIRRSPSSCTSRFARPRRTARTSAQKLRLPVAPVRLLRAERRPPRGSRTTTGRSKAGPLGATEEPSYASRGALEKVLLSRLWRNLNAVSGFRRAPPIARIANPIPASRSAMPTTIPNSEICSAM